MSESSKPGEERCEFCGGFPRRKPVVSTEGTEGSRVNVTNVHGNTFPIEAGEAVAEPSREARPDDPPLCTAEECFGVMWVRRMAQLEREIAEKDEQREQAETQCETVSRACIEWQEKLKVAEARVGFLEEARTAADANPYLNRYIMAEAQREKAEKEAHALKEILSDVAKYADTGSDSPETPWERLMQRVREALFSAGEHDQEGR